MAKYQTKPTIVDAVQWFKHGDHPAVKTSVSGKEPAGAIMVEGQAAGWIDDANTIGGKIVRSGDWVITSQLGDTYVMHAIDFEGMFDPVTE